MEDMQIKRSAAMVINWPTIVTESFDFATFRESTSRLPKRSQNTKSRSHRLTDLLDSARPLCPGHGTRRSFRFRNATLSSKRWCLSFAPTSRSRLSPIVLATFVNAVEYCEKQKLRMILAAAPKL